MHKKEEFQKIFKEKTVIKVHGSCRRDFTNDRHVSVYDPKDLQSELHFVTVPRCM